MEKEQLKKEFKIVMKKHVGDADYYTRYKYKNEALEAWARYYAISTLYENIFQESLSIADLFTN